MSVRSCQSAVPAITAERPLALLVYDFVAWDGITLPEKQWERLALLRDDQDFLMLTQAGDQAPDIDLPDELDGVSLTRASMVLELTNSAGIDAAADDEEDGDSHRHVGQ